MEDNTPQLIPKPLKRPRAARSLRRINIDLLEKKLLTIMNRVTDDLLDKTHSGTMKKVDIDALVNCMKLIPNLRIQFETKLANMTDEELEKIVKGNQP